LDLGLNFARIGTHLGEENTCGMPRSTLTKLRSTSFTCLPQVQLLLCRFFFLKLLRAVNAFQSQRLSTKVEVSDAESFSSTKHFVIEGWYTSSKIYDSKLLEKGMRKKSRAHGAVGVAVDGTSAEIAELAVVD